LVAEVEGMSSLTSSLIPPVSTQNQAATTVTNPNGFQSLSPADFVQMMVTQLQNQDPLNPTSSQDLLTQMSEIGQLQSSTQLQSTLTGLTLQNQIGAASSLIGKTVTGSDANSNALNGTVNSVTITQTPAAQSPTGVATSNVTLNLDNGGAMPLANVTGIAPPAQTGAAATTPAATTTTPPTPG
jgi:flagellar basal-body rod modification protein FlgD